jgi:hypothetical protein
MMPPNRGGEPGIKGADRSKESLNHAGLGALDRAHRLLSIRDSPHNRHSGVVQLVELAWVKVCRTSALTRRGGAGA